MSSLLVRLTAGNNIFWQLAKQLHLENPAVVEETIMNGRCLRVGTEFLALVDYKKSGLVVRLPKHRVNELIEQGIGQSFAPAGKIFKEWVSVPKVDANKWKELLHEGIKYVSQS